MKKLACFSWGAGSIVVRVVLALVQYILVAMLTIVFAVIKVSRSTHKIEPPQYLSILSQDICWQPQVITIPVKIISIRDSS